MLPKSKLECPKFKVRNQYANSGYESDRERKN